MCGFILLYTAYENNIFNMIKLLKRLYKYKYTWEIVLHITKIKMIE